MGGRLLAHEIRLKGSNGARDEIILAGTVQNLRKRANGPQTGVRTGAPKLTDTVKRRKETLFQRYRPKADLLDR